MFLFHESREYIVFEMRRLALIIISLFYFCHRKRSYTVKVRLNSLCCMKPGYGYNSDLIHHRSKYDALIKLLVTYNSFLAIGHFCARCLWNISAIWRVVDDLRSNGSSHLSAAHLTKTHISHFILYNSVVTK